MFTSKDLTVLQEPGSWEKIIAIQENLFPKLGALQAEANKLIYEIYKIDTNSRYKISQSPTLSSRKGQAYNFERRENTDYAMAGLRAAGKPSHLTRPNGNLCEMHFALLAFSINLLEEEHKLAVDFSPCILRYEKKHLLNLGTSLVLHGLDNLVLEYADNYWFSHDLPLEKLFQKHRAQLAVNFTDLLAATQQDLAKLVIAYALCFPMLDLFTRLSNGERVWSRDPSSLAHQPDYAKLFQKWHNEHSTTYLEQFYVEPISQVEAWKSEALTRKVFEELFNKSFPKTRPSWLKSSRSQARLELDGYCEELKLAFEYQGEYHYMEIPIHHQSRSLEEVQKNDALKLSLCQQNNINLIQVPYWEKGNKEYIVKALRSLHRPDIQQILSSHSQV